MHWYIFVDCVKQMVWIFWDKTIIEKLEVKVGILENCWGDPNHNMSQRATKMQN